MKTNKGFTMIELLAIIVILAIIALIAIPVVLNIIDKVRVSSYARSADNILETTRIYFKETQIDSTMSIEGNNYDKVMESIAGRKPDSGEIYIKKNGKIAIALKYSKYCYKKGYSDNAIIQTESTECSLAAELDENVPIITAKEESVTIEVGTSKEITSYFTIDSNGASGIKSTICKNGDTTITSTATLEVGNHTIECTVTKNNNKTASNMINIIVEFKPVTVADLKQNTVTEGDGLYLDSDEVYRYKGANPNNYIMLGEEEFRILAIEKQGIKIIRNTTIDNVAFDNLRRPGTNTYCSLASTNGCNAWAPTNEILHDGESSETLVNGNYSGTVTEPSSGYKYLYDTYYNNLISFDEYIVKNATWNVGPLTIDSDIYSPSNPLSRVLDEEKTWVWTGKIGLITSSEYIQALLSSSDNYNVCINDFKNSSCGENNWLNEADLGSTATLNSKRNCSATIIFLKGLSNGISYLTTDNAFNSTYGIRPVVYLTDDIVLSGNGTRGTNAFRIIEQ